MYCPAANLQDSLAASFKAGSAAEVTDLTNQLLGKLGDPYTQLLQGDDATALEAQEEGKVSGMHICSSSSSRHGMGKVG
jgi:hypothetical protein